MSIGPRGRTLDAAFMLMLYTGLRRSDVVRVGPQHIADSFLTIRQVMTDTEVSIPVHSALRDALRTLEATRGKALVYLTTGHGKAFTGNGFGNWFADRVNEAGLSGLSAHGLRKAIARRLAEAGATPHEIMSVTGHKTLKEVERYSSAANRRTMARSAIDLLDE